MKNRFRTKAPPGGWRCSSRCPAESGRRNVHGAHVLPRCAAVLSASLLLMLLAAPGARAQQEFMKSADLPDYSIKMWTDVWRPDILMFGRWIQSLGDINNDGYDDIAVASFADTTFIFLGGEEFSHDPVMFLHGGGGGIAAGDFNGDGRMDLATAIVQSQHRLGEPDPGYHGKIRYFLGRDAGTLFDTIPDLTLRGREMEGFGFYVNERTPGILALDYNGDGCSELIVMQYNLDALPSMRLAMYLGGATLDSVPVAYLQAREDIADQYFADDIMTGDINGDGNDDVLVHGSYYFSPMPIRIQYWDLHFGNSQFRTTPMDMVLSSDTGWSPQPIGTSNVVDINADGFDDIVDAFFPDDPGDVQLFLATNPLPQTILPNDTIPNTDRLGLRRPAFICPAGDMNGDGFEDVLIAWSDQIFTYGNLYLLYPGGPFQKYKNPLGVFGILRDEDHLTIGAYGVEDVNGDGYEDVAVLGRPNHGSSPKSYRFRIYLGSHEMRTSVSHPKESERFGIDIHPNPVASSLRYITVEIRSSNQSLVRLVLTDILGRTVHTSTVELSNSHGLVKFPIEPLRPGLYHLLAIQGENRTSQPIIIY